MTTLDAGTFSSDPSDSESPAVIDFSGTISRVEESESRRAESEKSGLATMAVDGLAGFACPEVMTGMETTTSPEVVTVGLAATISDERDPSSAFDFVAEDDALSPVEAEAPFPDCETLVPPAVLVVLGRGTVSGAVCPTVNEPPDPNRNSLDRLTAFVS